MIQKLDTDLCILEDIKTGEPSVLNPVAIATQLKDMFHIKTVSETGEILHYQDGRYVGNGEQLISQVMARDLSPLCDRHNHPMYSKRLKDDVMDLLKGLTYEKEENFDSHTELINMKNGFYNWQTGEFMPHNDLESPLYMSRVQIPLEYNPDATCEELERILRRIILPQDYIKVLEFIAYIFYRDYDIQKAMILYGPGGTGKSAFISMLDAMIGTENCSAVSFKDMGRAFSVASMHNKMLNKCGELSGDVIAETEKFKGLTSGTDSILTEHKYGKPFTFKNRAKIVWGTNSLPKINEDTIGFDDSFYRRVEIIMFLHIFRPEEYNKDDMDIMRNKEQLSGLFNRCIKLLPDLLKRHEFTNGNTAATTRKMYRLIADPIGSFAEQHITPCPDGEVSCEEMYKLYQEQCEKYLVTATTYNKFLNTIPNTLKTMKQGTMTIYGKKACCFKGVRLI